MTAGTMTIASLMPVTLHEMDAVAAFRTRKDRKYLVPSAEADALIACAEAGSRVLEIDGLRTFCYESVYFDTPDLDCYRAAALRRPRRAKVRTRSYLDPGGTFLEVKARHGRGLTVKHRLSYRTADRRRLTPRGLEFLQAIPAVASLAGRLQPTLTTRYRRTTLLGPDALSRITIDAGLECAVPTGDRVCLDEVVLIETKTDGHPSAFDRRLWASGHRPVKVSKYGTGLAALDPSLPANRWHRVLSNHFGARLHAVQSAVPPPALLSYAAAAQ